MRFLCATTFLTAALATSAADEPKDKKPTDDDITRLLVGKWEGVSEDAEGTIEYRKDGTYAAAGKVRAGSDKEVEVRVEGKWSVKDGEVTMEITKSSHPGLAPPGAKPTELVIAIGDKAMRVKSRLDKGKDKERERKRIKDKE